MPVKASQFMTSKNTGRSILQMLIDQDEGGAGPAAGGASSAIFGGAKPVDTLRKGRGGIE